MSWTDHPVNCIHIGVRYLMVIVKFVLITYVQQYICNTSQLNCNKSRWCPRCRDVIPRTSLDPARWQVRKCLTLYSDRNSNSETSILKLNDWFCYYWIEYFTQRSKENNSIEFRGKCIMPKVTNLIYIKTSLGRNTKVYIVPTLRNPLFRLLLRLRCVLVNLPYVHG